MSNRVKYDFIGRDNNIVILQNLSSLEFERVSREALAKYVRQGSVRGIHSRFLAINVSSNSVSIMDLQDLSVDNCNVPEVLSYIKDGIMISGLQLVNGSLKCVLDKHIAYCFSNNSILLDTITEINRVSILHWAEVQGA